MLCDDDDDLESIFLYLPASTQRRIDRAFDTVFQLGHQNTTSSTGINQLLGERFSEIPAGGYIVEDTPSSGYHTNLNERLSAPLRDTSLYIPLSEIPAALKILDLQTDDPEILSVFQKAASDWGAKDEDRGELVSKDDFRSICSVLLEGEEVEMVEEVEEEGETDHIYESDEYQEDDDDEYIDQKTTRSQRKPGRTTNQASSKFSNRSSVLPSLNTEQINDCRHTFSWFFPSISNGDLDRQKLTIEEVFRVAEDLKQSIKVEHISEMLEQFSSSPDKSMNLKDFERMMVAAKLV